MVKYLDTVLGPTGNFIMKAINGKKVDFDTIKYLMKELQRIFM
jgi:hypothetical protein